MQLALTEILRSYRLTGALPWWVLAQTRLVAATIGREEIVALVDRLMPVVERAKVLRRDYDRTRGRRFRSDDVRDLDREIDRQVASMYALIEALVRQGGPLAPTARRLLEVAFPLGLAAHVNAPYVEQASHNAALVVVLGDPAFADVIGWLRLDGPREALDGLAAAFMTAVAADGPIAAAEVHAAERAAENGALRLVCAIVAACDEDDPAQLAERDRLLAPYLDAQERQRREHRGRHASVGAGATADRAAEGAPPA